MNQQQLTEKFQNYFGNKHKVQQTQNLHKQQQKKQDINSLGITNLQYIPHKFQDLQHSKYIHTHHMSKIKTKWQTYTPYSFTKLSAQKKIQTFLQLFDDYNSSKIKLNQQTVKNKKLFYKITILQDQIRRIKDKNHLTPAQKIHVQRQYNQQNKQLKQQIKRLHQKILSLVGTKGLGKQKDQKRNKTMNKTQKIIVSTNQNIRTELQMQKKQVRQLLVIIDQLKKNKFMVQSQLKSKQLNQSTIPKIYKKQSVIKNQSQFQNYAIQLNNWKIKYQQLQLIYNKMNQDKDKQIKQLHRQLIDFKQNQAMKKRIKNNNQNKINYSNQLQQKNKQLIHQKDKLQSQLRRLIQMPFYQNNKQIIQLQQNYSDLQFKYKKLGQQLTKTRDTSMKYYAQLQYKIKQNNLLQNDNNKIKKQLKQLFDKQKKSNNPNLIGNIDQNDYYRKLLNLVKLDGDDPIWKKVQNFSTPSFSIMTQNQLRKLAQQLWRNKLQLIAHLQKAQVQLKSIKGNNQSKITSLIRDRQNLQQQLRITKARLDQWISMEKVNVRRDIQIYQQGGIKYDDSVSVFQQEQNQIKNLQSNQNYFDLYLGHLIIDQNSLIKNPQNKIKNIGQIVSFLTIDFYNHQTQHSDFSQGISKKLANNYSFKVQVNPYFIKFINRNSVGIQLWSPQGTSTVLLGRGQIWLRDLIGKTSKDISPVIRGKCPIYYQDRTLMATVQYRIRMRLSISPFLQWTQTKSDLLIGNQDPFSIGRKKRLSLIIQKGQNFNTNAQAFVYFTIQNQDYFTQPQKGPTPIWDYHQEIDVVLNQQFLDELKQKYVQFTIFDDQKQVQDDIYGIAKANLTPLIDSTNRLKLKLEIRNGHGQLVGNLNISVGWI